MTVSQCILLWIKDQRMDGYEIQDSCCSETGIMLQLKFAKTKVEDELRMNKQYLVAGDSNASIKKGSKEVLDLVKPWADTGMI